MGFIEKRSGHYRARYRDPLGRQRSETFTRKADAEAAISILEAAEKLAGQRERLIGVLRHRRPFPAPP